MVATCLTGKVSKGYKTGNTTTLFRKGKKYEVIPNGTTFYVISETGYKELFNAVDFHAMFK